MDSRQSLQHLFIFDLWCNRKLADLIVKEGAFRERDACIGFLSHIINAQRIWFDRVIDLSILDVEPWDGIDIQEMKREAKETHQMWIDLIGDHDMDLDAKIYYQNSAGVSFVNSFTDICKHLILHGQHHRAQISLLLSRSGIRPPEIDYIQYMRIKK